jgi:hypothetical protein
MSRLEVTVSTMRDGMPAAFCCPRSSPLKPGTPPVIADENCPDMREGACCQDRLIGLAAQVSLTSVSLKRLILLDQARWRKSRTAAVNAVGISMLGR